MANSKFQIEKGMLFRLFLSKFNTVDAFYKHILWLNNLFVAKRKDIF